MKILEATPSIEKFVEAWRRSFSQVLSAAGLPTLKVEAVDAKTCAARIAQIKEKYYWTTLNGAGSLQGTVRFITSEPEALQLSLVETAEPANRPGQLDEAQRGAAAQLIRRVAAQVLTLWGHGTARFESTPEVVDSAEPQAVCGGLRIKAGNSTSIIIALAPSGEFAESLRILEESSPKSDKKESGESTMVANSSPEPSSNFDLLFDVHLDAAIRFGGRQMMLREILSLGAGSVIELDRQVNEPAELLVAGRVVARGEVVVVNGNFGLRITDLTSASQRAELLSA
ncbi:MAG TPA: FliM/FliN family flagellar motor switch protein [Terriglobales bacterium]|nr:FliM/FliN family flagellar motor switch protein [Terriglobales bacterium]